MPSATTPLAKAKRSAYRIFSPESVAGTMSTRPRESSPSTSSTNRWLSPVSSENALTWTDGSSSDLTSPDFGSIPRDKSGARAAAVLALYESDLTNRPAMQCFDWIATEIRLSRKLRNFAASIVKETENNRADLDRTLDSYSHRSTMSETLPVVRNILRVALVEMRLFPETRTAIIISEAVKLSQIFDTIGAGKYVNGVLGAFARDAQTKVAD